ncbi:MAG: alpha-galactosidase, partial [Thermotoga sp.]
MKIFCKKLKEGSFTVEEKKYSLEWMLEKTHLGWIVSGRVKGKPGRLEVVRFDIPKRLLINNWQSWGPCKPVDKDFRLSGIKDLVKENVETLNIFSPVPDLLEGNILSDYFIAWDEGLLGFLSSEIAHPFFVTEGAEMVGYLDFFEVTFEDWVPLEKLLILEGSPV